MFPQHNGLPEFSLEFLEALSAQYDVEVFTDHAHTTPAPDSSVRHTIWPFEYYPARALKQPFDLNVYYIGNDAQSYEHIFRRALEQSGLAILDADTLFDLHFGMLWARGYQSQFWTEIEYCEGIEARTLLEQDMPSIERGELEPNHLRFSLLRRLIDNSRTVLVPSQVDRDRLRQRFPHRKIEAVSQVRPVHDGASGSLAERYRSLISDVTQSKPSTVGRPATPELATVPGINLIGDLSMAIGLSEAALNILEAMLIERIPVAYTELLYAANRQMRQADPRSEALTAKLPRGNRYPINLLHFNLNELPLVSEARLRELTNGKYTIANWFWELDQVPLHLRTQIGRVDEIWVSSTFARQSFAALTARPVQVIPLPITVPVSPGKNRAVFGLPDNRYVFFFHFSATSCDGRKNPGAVIRAFEQAFGSPKADGPLLLIKAQHLSQFPEMHHALQEDIRHVGGLLLTDNYTRQQMDDLLSCIDAYVSLHRAEAFGAGMAEAMYLGKPVIATDYSGNTDFMNTSNSYPVRCQLRLVTAEDSALSPNCQYLYEPGQVWAEPDIQHAAECMTFLYGHPDDGQAQGLRAAASIRQYCNPTVVGRMIAQRLRELSPLVQ